MRGIDYIKKRFDTMSVECIEHAIANMNLDVLYAPYQSEQEFKLELVENLKDFGFEFSKQTSLKSICEAIMDRESMERYEEALAKSNGPLSELEEWQIASHNYGRDSEVDVEIDSMEQYDGFDIADESDN